MADETGDDGDALRPELAALRDRLAQTGDDARAADRDKRHGHGYRTARENLADLVDAGSFQEYGQLAVAAQRSRRDYEELQRRTAGDGIITGTARINGDLFGEAATRTAVIINDYAVLAGTQGFFHHRKLDRLCELAERLALLPRLLSMRDHEAKRPPDSNWRPLPCQSDRRTAFHGD